jgi:UDP-N-acetylmuramyl pentapeptide phosphotransferase/UDP-N-acetylglucosamine-1-phosphate transferase
LYCLASGALVFGWFNFRKKAKCFAGDVGSIGMALALIFPVLLVIKATGNVLFILLFGIYAVDTVLTIFHRLLKRENIFEAHRQHVFQYLANEAGWSHISVTVLYMFLQMLLSAGLIYTWRSCSPMHQWIFAGVSLLVLCVAQILVKRSFLKKAIVQN